ncbi:MAG: hypothetical protein WD735_03865 [Balneolaceae bacterium]
MNNEKFSSQEKKKEVFLDFQRQKMVDWFSPSQLAKTGIQAVVSSVFGNYADKRELQAALSKNEQSLKPYDFSNREDIWVDYVSDIGSGWNSTYSVAYLLGRKKLNIQNFNGKDYDLERGEILVMGGDEVYPVATPEEYKNRLVGPYRSSLSSVKNSAEAPTLFAIPGNHDWYDGLSSFMKLFCQQRWMGGWQTKQNRSYFAIKLPNNWWLWGIDIQLSADIDKPQLDYFDRMCSLAEKGDKVILCTAEPSWSYQEYQKDDKPYQNLKFFKDRYALKGEKELNFSLILAGDLHHYVSFREENSENPKWRITAGGGGAFLHPTHQIPDTLNFEDSVYEKSHASPSKDESRRMAFKNLRFPFINLRFGVFFALVYMLFGWFTGTGNTGSLINQMAVSGLSDLGVLIPSILASLFGSPGLSIFLALIFFGILALADTNRKKPLSSWIAGIIHGIVQVILLIFGLWLVSYLIIGLAGINPVSVLGIILFFTGLGLSGWLLNGFAMGIYLLTCILVLKTHDTESFSSFRGEDYKSFVRMHVDADGLTIYPITIPRACRNWKEVEDKIEGEEPWFVPAESEDFKYSLIEDPINIKP